MSEEVKMPQMGESIAEGTIVRWLKQVGDQVKRDEPLFEISTDKVDAEIPSPSSGVLSEIKVNEGETVAVNTVVAIINGGAPKPAESQAAAPKAKPEPESSEAKEAAANEPQQAEAAPPQAAAPEREETPAVERPAMPSASAPRAQPREAEPAESAQPKQEKPSDEEHRTRSSPLVRKIAEEHGVDLSQIEGSGIGGRVTKNDIPAYVEGRPQAAKPSAAPEAPEREKAQ